jgi:hypothetical protein
MVSTTIRKNDMHKQLWPMVFQDTLVFSFEYGDKKGLFGVKNNYLNFIPQESIPDAMEISVPENVEEVAGFLASADFIAKRIVMTPEPRVEGLTTKEDPEKTRENALSIFVDFIRLNAKNTDLLDKLQYKWG